MALDFPATPDPGDTYTGPNDAVWTWDGVKWAPPGALGGAVEPGRVIVNALGAIGSSLVVDCGVYRVTTVTLTENLTTFALFSSAGPGTFINALIAFTQGGAGGYDVTFPNSFRWQGGYAPAMQWVPGSTDMLNVISYDGGASWIASIAVQVAP